MDLIIKNGTIVNSSCRFKGDVGVADGKIVCIAEKIDAGGCETVVDAEGKLVLPGAVDVHTHLAMPFGGTISSDDYYTGTRAAACGGTTTVFDFTKIPNGCGGIEQRYPYILSAANEGRITYEKAVALCAANPAKIFGCKTKGEISIGKDADIVIYDPEKDFTITKEAMYSNCDHTIWEGFTVHGYPVRTYSRGRLVYNNGEFVGEKGWGKFIKRGLK